MNMAFAHPGGLGLGCPPTCEMFCIEASEPSFDCNELLSLFMFSWNFIWIFTLFVWLTDFLDFPLVGAKNGLKFVSKIWQVLHHSIHIPKNLDRCPVSVNTTTFRHASVSSTNPCQSVSASVIGFSSKDFFLKKLLWGPRRSKSRDFLVSWSMTHYILRLVFFRDQPTLPFMSKNAQKC